MISASNPLPVHRIPLKRAFQVDSIFDSLSSKILPFVVKGCLITDTRVSDGFQQLDSRLMFSVLIYTSALIKTQQKHCSTSCSPPCSSVYYISRIFYYLLQSPAICVCASPLVIMVLPHICCNYFLYSELQPLSRSFSFLLFITELLLT